MNSVFVTVTSLIGRIRDENGNLKNRANRSSSNSYLGTCHDRNLKLILNISSLVATDKEHFSSETAVLL